MIGALGDVYADETGRNIICYNGCIDSNKAKGDELKLIEIDNNSERKRDDDHDDDLDSCDEWMYCHNVYSNSNTAAPLIDVKQDKDYNPGLDVQQYRDHQPFQIQVNPRVNNPMNTVAETQESHIDSDTYYIIIIISIVFISLVLIVLLMSMALFGRINVDW